MWIVVAVILALVLSRALNKASKNKSWTEEDDWAQLDEDLDNEDYL